MISVISKSPKNGAEIIDEIEKMSFGGWRPSPGSVYPLLDEMSQELLIQKRQDGRYELTEKGKQEMDWPFGAPMREGRNTIESILSEMKDSVSYLEDLKRSAPQKIESSKETIKIVASRLSNLVSE